MSYSVCLKCGKMVYRYEKYCIDCSEKYHQDMDFWKNNRRDEIGVEEELKKDKI